LHLDVQIRVDLANDLECVIHNEMTVLIEMRCQPAALRVIRFDKT
jgi:hypothetical protein